MYSLNVPVPGIVKERAWELRRPLTGVERHRDELSLVVKRLEARTSGEFAAESQAVREWCRGTPPFEIRLPRIETFEDPPAGPAPVIYLAVESPAIEELHATLVDALGAVTAVEGDHYVPHITLGRGLDDPAVLAQLDEHSFEPISWSVERLCFWDARREVEIGSVPLPA